MSQVRSLWNLGGYDGPLEASVVYSEKRAASFYNTRACSRRIGRGRGASFRSRPKSRAGAMHALFLAHVGNHGDTTGQTFLLPSGRPETFATRDAGARSRTLASQTSWGLTAGTADAARAKTARAALESADFITRKASTGRLAIRAPRARRRPETSVARAVAVVAHGDCRRDVISSL